ncbi:MAG TPA: hypothetical protein HA341_04725 [Halobacteria archaeon]|nr:hypothetical protein [Halobacteria archaeon]
MRKLLVSILVLFVLAMITPLITAQSLPEKPERVCQQLEEIRPVLPQNLKEYVSQPSIEFLSNEESTEVIDELNESLDELKDKIDESNEKIDELSEKLDELEDDN